MKLLNTFFLLLIFGLLFLACTEAAEENVIYRIDDGFITRGGKTADGHIVLANVFFSFDTIIERWEVIEAEMARSYLSIAFLSYIGDIFFPEYTLGELMEMIADEENTLFFDGFVKYIEGNEDLSNVRMLGVRLDLPGITSSRDEKRAELLAIIGGAMHTDDASEIERAIEGVTVILGQDGERYVNDIYYIKAQLLFRLHRHDEALETFNKTQFNFDIQIAQRAALLILMGRDREAKIILDGFLASYIESINEGIDVTHAHIQTLAVVSRLLERSFEDTLNDNTNSRLTVMRLYEFVGFFDGLPKERILESMWPPGISAMPTNRN